MNPRPIDILNAALRLDDMGLRVTESVTGRFTVTFCGTPLFTSHWDAVLVRVWAAQCWPGDPPLAGTGGTGDEFRHLLASVTASDRDGGDGTSLGWM